MDNLIIEATVDSPKVTLDSTNAFICIEGKSFPGDAFGFYLPVIEWLNEYFSEVAKVKTIVEVKLLYYNSATSQALFNIFDVLNLAVKNNEIEVHWFYDEENSDSYDDYEDMNEEYPDLHIQAITK